MKLVVAKADTLWSSVKGLIGDNHPRALYFTTRFGIHTFGVKFPIDVLILDATHHVMITKKNLRPNRIFIWPPKWGTVVELPAGTITARHITLGTPLQLSFIS